MNFFETRSTVTLYFIFLEFVKILFNFVIENIRIIYAESLKYGVSHFSCGFNPQKVEEKIQIQIDIIE